MKALSPLTMTTGKALLDFPTPDFVVMSSTPGSVYFCTWCSLRLKLLGLNNIFGIDNICLVIEPLMQLWGWKGCHVKLPWIPSSKIYLKMRKETLHETLQAWREVWTIYLGSSRLFIEYFLLQPQHWPKVSSCRKELESWMHPLTLSWKEFVLLQFFPSPRHSLKIVSFRKKNLPYDLKKICGTVCDWQECPCIKRIPLKLLWSSLD